ncbi:hypothetical protein FBZ83_12368 [Azospirillum brasilense]|uniref:Uncharacterized protein n=1 Tax=Azospirillum brasilense TaxID=192 RepID=A0A560BSN9_AZOBR|nr:hypothetical protein [Azospirillum brasilense]TWA75641.1 hypothetical protein FBZ83_12368 [Azospirillum brasilense]
MTRRQLATHDPTPQTPKASAELANDLAAVARQAQDAEQHVAELEQRYRAALLKGDAADSEAAGLEEELTVARRQVTRKTVQIEMLQQEVREAEQREREAAEAARIEALTRRRDAMAERVRAMLGEVDTTYRAAALTIVDFIDRWNALKSEALALEPVLLSGGLAAISESQLAFGGADLDRWVPVTVERSWAWAVDMGDGTFRAPTLYTIVNGEQVPQDPTAVRRVTERKIPAHMENGQKYRPVYGFDAVHLPSPRLFEPAIRQAKRGS